MHVYVCVQAVIYARPLHAKEKGKENSLAGACCTSSIIVGAVCHVLLLLRHLLPPCVRAHDAEEENCNAKQLHIRLWRGGV